MRCSKATTLERTYGPAWIAYGHSFAVESEHDQAMAAYFTAAQLMKGLVDLLVLPENASSDSDQVQDQSKVRFL